MGSTSVSIDLLLLVTSAPKDLSGSLHSSTELEIRRLAERLKQIGLIFSYTGDSGCAYTAHPFLRAFFEKLVDVEDPRRIHDVVRRKLMAGLETRPDVYPEDSDELNRYEQLIEITRLAGRLEGAVELFRYGLGGYPHLGQRLGEFSRGQRIVSALFSDSVALLKGNRLTRSFLGNTLAAFEAHLGDLEAARQLYLELRKQDKARFVRESADSAAMIEVLAGRFVEARRIAEFALEQTRREVRKYHRAYRISEDDFDSDYDMLLTEYLDATMDDLDDDAEERDSYGQVPDAFYVANRAVLSLSLAALGEGRRSGYHQQAANRRDFKPGLFCRDGIMEAESDLLFGDRPVARILLSGSRMVCSENEWLHSMHWCEVLIGFACLPDSVAEASRYLDAAQQYAAVSDDVQISLMCYQLAAEVARRRGDLSLAETEANNGIELADSCGFGRWSFDIRLELGRVYLAQRQFEKAIVPAEWVVSHSDEKHCQYYLGKADGLHQLGVAWLEISEMTDGQETRQAESRSLVRNYLTKALALPRPKSCRGGRDD